ncbi:protein MpGT64.1 [Marchantia polymorpha subsp. ruderalis]
MGEKDLRYKSSGSCAGDWCDVSMKCRCRWRWGTPGFCSRCHDKSQHRTCFLSSTFIFFLTSILVLGAFGKLFAWLTFAPFEHEKYAYGAGCQPDNEGSWAIGFYRGSSPFSLRPTELEGLQSDKGSAWPVANPILTCASIKDPNNPSNFVADPFLFSQGTNLFVFFETKNTLTLQGDIGVAKSEDQGATWHFVGIALDEDWHLSYPFVFEHQGKIYMMPEGSKKGDLRLYHATNFPLQWSLVKVIIRRPLVDASMVEFDGLFWIFGSDSSRYGAVKNGELEIWYASSPLGPWKPHIRNPVHNVHKSFGARSAGRPFIWEGKLYRLGQDCGDTYGKRVRAFQVEILTPSKFQEVEVPLGIIEPSWKKGRYAWNGVRHHHLDVMRLSSGDWIAVMDGDRVPSGDRSARIALGSIGLLILITLTFFVGLLYGFVRCGEPTSRPHNAKKGETPVVWARPQLISPMYRAVARLKRSGSTIKGRVRARSCMGCSLIIFSLIVGIAFVCLVVSCLFGGNGVEEPYAVEGQFSQFTMVTMTYADRLWNLRMFVKHYSRCASVREIVVVWNKGVPPNPLRDFDSAVPVRIRVEPINSLNNRFRLDPLIKTRAVLELDDDIMMTCDDVERGFKAWRERPERLVGFYPRLVEGRPLEYRNERFARSRAGYNMILTGAAFMDIDMAFPLYWSDENEKGRAIVDELFNCEDILMNFILGNRTESQPVEYVHPSWALDTSKLSNAAISRDTKVHYNKRTYCLLRFSQLYGKLPLKKVEFHSRADGWDY